MTGHGSDELSPATSDRAELVWFVTERGVVISYSVVLVAQHRGAWQTIRVYDNAHGQNEMHRHALHLPTARRSASAPSEEEVNAGS